MYWTCNLLVSVHDGDYALPMMVIIISDQKLMQSCSKPAISLVARMLGFLDASTMESRSCPPKGQTAASDADECCFQANVRQSHIIIDGDYLSYDPKPKGLENGVGVWKADEPVNPEMSYFEVEIMDAGMEGNIFVGLCSADHPLDCNIGYSVGSVALSTSECRLVQDGIAESIITLGCDDGDHIGCGVHFDVVHDYKSPTTKPMLVPVFFTKNGKEMGSLWVSMPADGLYPAVSLNSIGEEVRVMLGLSNISRTFSQDDQMLVDGQDDDWSELSDVQLRGELLEYAGQGKSKTDVGLAQARFPLDTTAHYFEVEIVDPGENCYIAVGLTRKDYPKHRHPGWNKGSIAYHADDGKIFIGSSIGDPFGPRCHKGDRMGCGIYFPPNYKSCDGDFENGCECSQSQRSVDVIDWSDSGDGWCCKHDCADTRPVKVFFTRNGKIIGMRQVPLPDGGFFPSVGMMGANEKVRVHLRPLTG